MAASRSQITPNELEVQEQQLRREADRLLLTYDIIGILQEFGIPHLTGSYSLELMTWRDLDIYLEMQPLDRERFLEMGKKLGVTMKPRRLSFKDHINFPATEGLIGLYYGIHTNILSVGGWKIDLWGLEPSVCTESLRYCESLKSRIVPEQRQAILTIKNEICRHPNYRNTIRSQHIYDAVLEGCARSTADFWAYIKRQDNTM